MRNAGDRMRDFMELMKPTTNVLNLRDLGLELNNMGFFLAPASTKYHGNYEGGLYDHSENVTHVLLTLTKDIGIKWSRPESPYIIGMFHDLCKCDNYIQKDLKTWEYNKDTELKGHGDKSVMIASTLAKLTYEEVLCIRYHMGAFVPQEEWSDYTRAIHNYDTVLWTHTADMVAAHVIECG